MKKITPFLWFDGEAEQAAKFYVSIFDGAKITEVTRYGEVGPAKKGSVMSVKFTLEGREYFALNGGPQYKPTPAVSFFVDCKTQKEVDTLWKKLGKGGKPGQCGWLEDKYGFSWQIVPSVLWKLLKSSNEKKAAAAMRAMMEMDKLDIKKMQDAFDGG